MTTPKMEENDSTCPAQALLKLLSGKWKPEIFRLAQQGPVRFNTLLRQLDGANRQALTVALKDLEASELLVRTVVQAKPLHVAYHLSEKGQALVPVFQQLEALAG